jgi:hypothetical protein
VSTGLVTTTIRDLVPTPIISLSGQSTVSEGLSAAYAVSLTGGGLLPGQSFSLTLAAVGGTATDITDFVALLLEGALTAGEGITLGKVSIDPATKAASLSVTNSSQKALAVGAQLLSFNVATIADSAAEGNETYSVNLSSSTATVTTGSVTTTITDVASSTQPPAGTPPTINSFDPISGPINGVNLGLTSFGYAIRPVSGSTIQIKLSGRFVSLTNPGAGWIAIAAAPDSSGTGYELFWKNSVTGQYVRWVLDASGNYSSGALLSTSELLAAESRLNIDLNGDSSTGLTFSSAGQPIGNVTFGSNQLGYAIRDGATPPIQVSFSGQIASPSNPGAGWSAIAAAATATGYELFWKNSVTGQFARWILDASGNLSSGALLSTAELLAAESRLNTDLNGDSSTGLTFSSAGQPIGNVTFGSNQLGYAIRNGAATPIQVSFSGQVASSSNPGAGWSAIAAAATTTGYELFWKNAVTGQFVRWILDTSGNLSSGALLSTSELLTTESRLNTDLNRDSITGIGALNTPLTSTINGLSLGNTSFGYALQSGTNSAIPISLFGQLVSASNPGGGWSTIAAASSSTGYDLYWKNTPSGQFARWNLNSSGAYASGALLSNLELINAESSLGFDLTGNGIGVI